MAGVLGWNAATEEAEVESVRRRVAAELRAEQLPDDASAHAAIVDAG
jgi:hypothetical protein